MENYQRGLVQRVKEARTISVIVNDGAAGYTRLDFKHGDIRRLRHEIAIAVQDHFTRNEQ